MCYGQVEEAKVENFEAGEENFICIENDGKIRWLDKESLIFLETLRVKTTLLVKSRITDYFRVDGKVDKDAFKKIK